jgi:ubiquitin-conjugating enzyme E2 variant
VFNLRQIGELAIDLQMSAACLWRLTALLNQILVPRTFRLYEELEKAEHAQLSDQSVSYGLDKGDDQTFTQWNGTIVGPPNTNFDNRIFFLNIECGPNYPQVAPLVRFTSRINLPSVN